MPNSGDCDVAIVGAGPYGLSIAAHLRATDVRFRIFGSPMEAWRTRMAAGMYLKSEGCASSLSDPSGRFTLGHFCRENGSDYGNYAVPVPLDTFIRYGTDFQRRLVPNVEQTPVISINQRGAGFELRLGTTEIARAGAVIVAIGLTYFGQIPVTLQGLPPGSVSHSSQHADLSLFRGRDVTVLGGGQSALETAALLSEHGADVRVLVRRPVVAWNSVPSAGPRTLRRRVRRPMSGLGVGWRTFFYSEMPMGFRHLPQEARLRTVRTALGPSGAWWLRERVEGHLPILLGHVVSDARMAGGRVRLRVEGSDRDDRVLVTDHVIAATGYRVNLEAVPFLDASLLTRVRRVPQAPALSANFESSVSGLYFVGAVAAETFGPVMRFVHGADFTASRLARHLQGNGNGGRLRRAGRTRRSCRG